MKKNVLAIYLWKVIVNIMGSEESKTHVEHNGSQHVEIVNMQEQHSNMLEENKLLLWLIYDTPLKKSFYIIFSSSWFSPISVDNEKSSATYAYHPIGLLPNICQDFTKSS